MISTGYQPLRLTLLSQVQQAHHNIIIKPHEDIYFSLPSNQTVKISPHINSLYDFKSKFFKFIIS